MPQMKPLSWGYLYIILIFMFLMVITHFYFEKNNSVVFSNIDLDKAEKFWKWY